MISVFDADHYTIPASHVLSTYIREYDIAKANISILLTKGLITPEQYAVFYNMPKHEREVKVGLMQKYDKNLSRSLMEGFGEARKIFYEANNIKEHEILSVKKDAIFLMDRAPTNLKFGNIEFKFKNEYTSFYNLPGIEVYYQGYGNVEKIDVKGIGNESLLLHKDYMLELLCVIFSAAQTEKAVDVLSLISGITEAYLSGEMGVEYYREFNNRSWFRTYYTFDNERAYLRYLDKDIGTKDIDPSYNHYILQLLYSIFSERYIASMQF